MITLIHNHIELIGLLAAVLVAIVWGTFGKRQEKAAERLLQEAVSSGLNEPLTLHPEINADLCSGCGACTRVCPEGDILGLIDNKAVLVSPTKCVGHGECEKSCPVNAITLVFGTKTMGFDMPRLDVNFESNVPGVYIVGELGGMGLIRNAMKQGAAAARHAAGLLNPEHKTDYDLIIVGAGPAGMAAGLSARLAGIKYVILDQREFGGSINSFPRQKLIMTAPGAEMPGFGMMRFSSDQVTKADLMEYWNRIREKAGLMVKENVRFENFSNATDFGFQVQTTGGVFTCQRLILAMGVRGSPRRLGLVNEGLSKVTYSLTDSAQYLEKDICIVGGGNNAVEAAILLSDAKTFANRVTLVVRTKDFDRCNQTNRDIIAARATEGRVQVLFESQVLEIHPEAIVLDVQEAKKTIPNDFLFLMIGAEMPFRFLNGLGIQIERKFGEAMKKA